MNLKNKKVRDKRTLDTSMGNAQKEFHHYHHLEGNDLKLGNMNKFVE